MEKSVLNSFCSAEDGLKTLREKINAWKYHKVKRTEVVEKRKRKDSGRGRPKNGEDTAFYHIKAGFEEDEGAREKEMLRKVKFIVG